MSVRELKVVVLCGGDGPEREVSLNSGAAVLGALHRAGFEAEAVDLKDPDAVTRLRGIFDIAFVAMHGDWGEDGTLQAALEATEIPYTGSGPDACALAMHKGHAQEIFSEAGLTVPRGMLLHQGEDADYSAMIRALGDHLVVKPCSGGSTVGVTILEGASETALRDAVNGARRYDSEVLIEVYVAGRELTVAVLERDGVPSTLPVIEIVPHAGFYDYANKYTAGATEYRVPAPLEAEVLRRVEAAALAAHRALGCRAYSRADFRLSNEGDPHILEVNTAPGMTATSLVPKAGCAAGLSFPELVRTIVENSWNGQKMHREGREI